MPLLSGPSLLPRTDKPQKLVVLLHGYGADGQNLLSLAHDWAPHLPGVEFIAPNAPDVCEQNSRGYQWFSMINWTLPKILEGLRAAAPTLQQFLDRSLEERKLGYQDLALLGFSQGAMLALYQSYYVLTKCAGVMAYSGAFLEETGMHPKNLPDTLLIHGNADDVVPVQGTIYAEQRIKELGGHPQTIILDGLSHEISEEGVELGQDFLRKVLYK
jgi:phospholipase/carboxylesterase